MPSTTTHQDPVLPRLEERFSGDVIRPSDARYGVARTLWNAIVDRRPALIARPRTPQDVATAILSAREADLEIAIRCGGHSLPGHSMAEGGITIDPLGDERGLRRPDRGHRPRRRRSVAQRRR